MEFFASAYNNNKASHNLPKQSPQPTRECAGQGYGCEANAHLRRASLGLESDITSPQSHHTQFSYGRVHHKNYGNNGGNNKDSKKNGDKSYFSLSATPSGSPRTSPPPSPPPASSPRNNSFRGRSPRSHSPQSYSPGDYSPRGNSPSSPVCMMPPLRRASVSNPCLLHHTNTEGGGVRSPVMPRSFSFHLDKEEDATHEKPIPEDREPGL
ncbi:hypothetical protein BGX21_009564 [Mortierella sp. AD011]|nr:hypothetical protein BGX21_009564 [Mortierella sp. AD011]